MGVVCVTILLFAPWCRCVGSSGQCSRWDYSKRSAQRLAKMTGRHLLFVRMITSVRSCGTARRTFDIAALGPMAKEHTSEPSATPVYQMQEKTLWLPRSKLKYWQCCPLFPCHGHNEAVGQRCRMQAPPFLREWRQGPYIQLNLFFFFLWHAALVISTPVGCRASPGHSSYQWGGNWKNHEQLVSSAQLGSGTRRSVGEDTRTRGRLRF